MRQVAIRAILIAQGIFLLDMKGKYRRPTQNSALDGSGSSSQNINFSRLFRAKCYFDRLNIPFKSSKNPQKKSSKI